MELEAVNIESGKSDLFSKRGSEQIKPISKVNNKFNQEVQKIQLIQPHMYLFVEEYTH